MKKVLFVNGSGMSTFIDPIKHRLHSMNEYECRHLIMDMYGYKKNEWEIVYSHYEWADVIWFEWANELTLALTKMAGDLIGGGGTLGGQILNQKKVIIRLHAYESFTDWPKHINWNCVDDIMFVASHVRDRIAETLTKVKVVPEVSIIPNGVDLDKFAFEPKWHQQKPLEFDPGFNLAYVGYLNWKKGSVLLLHAFRALVEIDNRYRLHIAGRFQSIPEQQYWVKMIKDLGLTKNIVLDGWRDDLSEWFKGKGQIICSSITEACPVGILEGMASGLRPIIHDYIGRDSIFPPEFVWKSIDDFVESVKSPFSENDSMGYREWIEVDHDFDAQILRIRQVIDG